MSDTTPSPVDRAAAAGEPLSSVRDIARHFPAGRGLVAETRAARVVDGDPAASPALTRVGAAHEAACHMVIPGSGHSQAREAVAA